MISQGIIQVVRSRYDSVVARGERVVGKASSAVARSRRAIVDTRATLESLPVKAAGSIAVSVARLCCLWRGESLDPIEPTTTSPKAASASEAQKPLESAVR